MATIAVRVKKLISETIGVKESTITEEQSFVNDLGVDSLDISELMMAFEDEFQIKISDDKAKELKTVADAINYITDVLK